ncbi:MAG: tetratricopeptide repeat protein [Candidatus Lustribacter sp.]|jgi:tetratricopeptide (TPR) repeat protein
MFATLAATVAAQSIAYGASAPATSIVAQATPSPKPSAKARVAAKKPPAKPKPAVAHAQTAAPHVAPKLLERGTNTTPAAGPGDVEVQVFVKKDGTFTISRIIKSTNPANNDAALEIAKSSKYAPATRGGKPVDEYYDFAFAFGGGTAALGTPPPSTGGPLAAALATIHAGNYDQAKTQLQTYIAAHPGDTQAQVLLGVADSFGGDPAGAATAFDKAGTVPDQYKALALQSYEKYATAALNGQHYNDAVTAAGHAIDINPQDIGAYYTRGVAYTDLSNYTAAIADLQKTASLAIAAKTDTKTMLAIDFNLAVAQLNAGQYGEAATSARDIYRDDVDMSGKLDKAAFVSVTNAAIPLANAGNIPAAVSRLESGAAAFPHEAGALTGEAAYIMATDKKPDWDKIKAEAEKALALDPDEGRADFVLGIQAAQKSDAKTALDYMNKAKASPDYAADPGLAKQIDDALTKLNASTKL